jgi:predicted RND superfamily exporter protein
VSLVDERDPEWQARRAELLRAEDAALLPEAAIAARLDDARRDLAIARALPPLRAALALPASDEPRLAALLDDLLRPAPPEVAARAELTGEVAGEPVLARGFSRSVARNLDVSLALSVALVLLLLYALFRSLRDSLVCMFPSLMTLAILFAALGLMGVHIDLGTSLVAGIATGAGSDFAMHYLWYLRRQPAGEVNRTVGPIMAASIVLVSLGFFVLALGRSPVMHLCGTLAALSMFLSALLSCLLLPALRPSRED